MVHEPTIGELSRGIQRLEEQVKALGADIREVRDNILTVGLIRQQVGHLEQRIGELADSVGALDARLRAAESDLAARKDAAERSKRTATWISVVISTAAFLANILYQAYS